MNLDESKSKAIKKNLIGDLFGGTTAMLVALPSAIAFGLIIYAPLGAGFSGKAAVGGIIGTIVLGLFAPIFGGTKRLVTAPCAPAAAVLAVFVAELLKKGTVTADLIPVYIMLISFSAGILQIIIGKIGGGQFIKYIPYPVVAGYMSGVGVLIFIGQLPKILGLPDEIRVPDVLSMAHLWKWESCTVGIITIVVMFLSAKIIKAVPAAIIALLAGVTSYFCLSFVNPSLLKMENNHFIIGAISTSGSDLVNTFSSQWQLAFSMNFANVGLIIAPVLTLAVLLSIDTLKTCVVLDTITYSRHDSSKELVGQGLGNVGSAILCGIPGAGTMGATLVNLSSGGKTKMSGVIVGITALLVLLLFGKLVAWIPISALAGILIVVAIRMVDYKSIFLLKHKSTVFDFVVILGVVISAVTLSLITAAGVGIAMAIILFLREQIRTSVIRRKAFGNQLFSKKTRDTTEHKILEDKGKHSIVVELQGQLFFGTADQLLSEIEPMMVDCKYVLLDMRRVQSVDYTAANRIKQILGRLKKQNGFLIFTSVPMSLPTGQNVKDYIERLGLSETEHLKFFDNLDLGLEWVEDELLQENLKKDDDSILEMRDIELLSGFSEKVFQLLELCFENKSYVKNEIIFEINDEGDEIYFVRRGKVEIVLPIAGGTFHRLVTIAKGGFFGDMAFLDKRKRSANAIAVNEVLLYVFHRKKFDEICILYPEIAGQFFEKLAFVISNRLRQNDNELRTLQEN